jgi:flagellar basal-body rod protein FlgB
MALFDKTIDTLSTSLDLLMVRQQVISDNIANAETPGFKARRVDFENELQRAVDSTETGSSSRELASVNAKIYEDPRSELGLDLNSVDMDREMSELTKTDVKYSAATQAINRKFNLLKYAISEDH